MTKQKMKLKKADSVIVITGKDKGKVGEIIKIFPSELAALVVGVNLKTHHKKPSSLDVGGKILKESKIQISNIAFYDSELRCPVKLGFKVDSNGAKVRFNKRTGTAI